MDAIKGKATKIKYNRDAQCDVCHGTGAKPGKSPVTCHQCGGQGYILHQRQTMMGMMQSQEVCPTCHGTGQEVQPGDQCTKCHGAGHVSERHELKVKVPAGVDDGQQMRLQGQGEVGQNGGLRGLIHCLSGDAKSGLPAGWHDDLCRPRYFVYPSGPCDKIKVKTVHGDVDLKIPAGTESETNFRLRGKECHLSTVKGR